MLGNDATPIVTIAEFKKGHGSLETTEVSCHLLELGGQSDVDLRDDDMAESQHLRCLQECRVFQLHWRQGHRED